MPSAVHDIDLIKVMHDSVATAKMHLQHLWDVKIQGVANMSCFHRIQTHAFNQDPPMPLHEVLEQNGFTPPPIDSSQYEDSEEFWAQWPLTNEMIQMCVEDVKQLHWLLWKQAMKMKKKS